MGELVYIVVPANTFTINEVGKNGLFLRKDKLYIDLNINEKTFLDRRSQCDFSKYIVKKNYNTFKAWEEYMTYGVIDLFCGVGGLTCGLEKAGLDVVAGYDLDATCEYTYSHNNNAQFIHKNIEEVTGLDIKDGCEDMM